MNQRPARRLLLSIHDVSPRFESQVKQLFDLIGGLIGAPRLAMLVVPDYWGAAPLRADPRFCGELRRWSELGVEMFVHGFTHRDTSRHGSRAAAFKARHLTANEGEFLGLTRTEAARRMREGRDVVEQAIGREAAGFIAPAWLYGPGAQAALREERFALAEDHFRVWRPADGAILARGPVITWASRSPMRRASSRAFALGARAALTRLRTVRIAVHPGDVAHPLLLRSIARTVAAFRASHRPSRYADLAAGAAAPAFR
jgi:predicted deacetylase